VGSCVAGAGSACRPFLAFVALTAAAGAALALLVLAYKALQKEQAREVEQRRSTAHAIKRRERVLHPTDHTAATQQTPTRGWHVTA
jgi:hypothetical protein